MQQKLLISELVGQGRISATKVGARKWLTRFGIPFAEHPVQGGVAHTVVLHLPEQERRAVLERQVEALSLPSEQYDDAAHAGVPCGPSIGARQGGKPRRYHAGFACFRSDNGLD